MGLRKVSGKQPCNSFPDLTRLITSVLYELDRIHGLGRLWIALQYTQQGGGGAVFVRWLTCWRRGAFPQTQSANRLHVSHIELTSFLTNPCLLSHIPSLSWWQSSHLVFLQHLPFREQIAMVLLLNEMNIIYFSWLSIFMSLLTKMTGFAFLHNVQILSMGNLAFSIQFI